MRLYFGFPMLFARKRIRFPFSNKKRHFLYLHCGKNTLRIFFVAESRFNGSASLKMSACSTTSVMEPAYIVDDNRLQEIHRSLAAAWICLGFMRRIVRLFASRFSLGMVARFMLFKSFFKMF